MPGEPIAKQNRAQFQKGRSLSAFLLDKLAEEKFAADALAKPGRHSGFECLSCGCAKRCRLERRNLRQRAECGRRASAAAGTLFEHAKLPLATWFQAFFLTARGGEVSRRWMPYARSACPAKPPGA